MAYQKAGAALAILGLGLGLILSGCSSPEEKEAKYIKRGNELFDQGEYEKARVEYKNAARIKPADTEVRYRLGLVEEAEGNLRAAYADFLYAEQQNAHYHPALLKLAQYTMAGQQYDQALKRIDSVLADTTDDAEAHALHAAYLLHQKDYVNAEKEAQSALVKAPSSALAFSVLAGIYKTEGDLNKAIATIEDAIARNPKDPSLLLLQAALYEQANNLGKAAQSYQRLFELRPKEDRFRIALAAAYLKKNQTDDAEAALRAGIAALPDDWNLEHQLVLFLADRRGVDAAEKEIRDLMRANPKIDDLNFWLVDLYVTHNAADKATALLEQIVAKSSSDALGLKARALLARIDLAKGDKDQARKLSDQVLEKDSGNLEALFVRANLAVNTGAYQSAVADLRRIIRDNPKASEAYMLLAEALMHRGHLDLATDTLKQMVDFDPLNLAGQVRLAQMYDLNGDPKLAMQTLAAVTKNNPKYNLGWESTARIAIQAKDWPTAENAVTKLNSLEGQHMTAAFLKGQILAATGKNDEAIAQFTEVIDADPNSPLVEHALPALVDIYRSLKRLPAAAQYIASLKTGSPYVATVLGECDVALDKKAEAAALFDKAIAKHPAFQEPYMDRARLYTADKNFDAAVDLLKQASAAAPGDIRAPVLEASLLGAMGKYQDVIALYDALLERNPEMDAIANNLAEIIADYEYNDGAAMDKAKKAAERFTGSNSPAFLDTLAWVYYRLGDIEQAQTVMERTQAAAASAKLPAQVHYHFGAIMLAAGKTEQAKAELQQANVAGVTYPGRNDAKKMLEGMSSR